MSYYIASTVTLLPPIDPDSKQTSCTFKAWYNELFLPSPSMSMLQASPSPLISVSVCIGLLSNGQLSQLSPTPSLSESNCRGLYISGQLSCVKKTHIHMDVCIRQDTPVFNHGDFKVVLSHPFICDAIIVIIRVTGIALSVRIQVFLSRVWQDGAIILQPVTTKINGIQPECSLGISQQV